MEDELPKPSVGTKDNVLKVLLLLERNAFLTLNVHLDASLNYTTPAGSHHVLTSDFE